MVYVGMTLLLGFAAVNTGNNLLYLLVSALLGFMAVSGWLGQRNLRQLQLEVKLPSEIFAGQPVLVGVRLHNRRRRLAAFLIRIELGEEPPLFARVAAGASEERSLMLAWPTRGPQRIENLWLSSCFPINFFVRSIRLPIARDLLVFPRPLAAPAPVSAGSSARKQHAAPRAFSGDSGDLRSIQDYRGGEPLKTIHWKHSARHDSFKVKQYEGLGSEPILIEFDRLEGSLEQRLGRAAWLIIEQLRRQRPVGLKLAGHVFAPQTGGGQRRRLLSELALYHGG